MYQEIAKQYLESGLNPVPVKAGEKIPVRSDWVSPIGKDLENYDFEEIGICTGAISGGLEGIDMDLQNAEDPDKVWREWTSKVPNDILEKLVVCRTRSGGYHLIYRTDVIEGNQKLAKLENKNVLIETRGEGGYLKCYPSDGYEMVHGDLTEINKITDYERAILFSTSKLFDQALKKTKKFYKDGEFNDPFPEYNGDASIGLELLEDNGWTIERSSDDWVEFTRPGKTSGVSAGYNLEGKFLYVFTTSTEFEVEKPYSNSALFCMLEHEGDYKSGYRALRQAGYGKKDKLTKEEKEREIEDMSFLSQDGEDEDKLMQAIEGTLPLGLSFGWPSMDEYHVWKDNTLNFCLAFEGVGKTYFEIHKMVALSVLYGKKWAMSCGENETYSIKRYIIEALSGRDISYFSKRYTELSRYKEFMNAHFFIIKNEEHYSIEDVLERAKRVYDEHTIHGVFIDPFSYYKKSLSNQYAYIDDLLSKLNIFSKTVCSIIMSLHPHTDATRQPKDAEGYLKPPTRYDATHGNMWANRGDSFIVYHRILNHKIPKMRNIMEVRVEKVKDILTGGRVTASDECLSMTYKTMNGFKGYYDSENRNPIYEAWHKPKDPRSDLPKPSAQDAFLD